jgi:hypothetical protein
MILLSDIEHGMLIAAAAGTGYNPTTDQCISRITRDGQFLGGTIYTGYNGAVIWGHFAGVDGWLSPELVWVSFDYPFMQLKVNQILATVSSENAKALSLVRKLGFKQLYKIKDGAPNGAALILFSMSKANCKWLKLRERYLKANGHAGGHLHAQV